MFARYKAIVEMSDDLREIREDLARQTRSMDKLLELAQVLAGRLTEAEKILARLRRTPERRFIVPEALSSLPIDWESLGVTPEK